MAEVVPITIIHEDRLLGPDIMDIPEEVWKKAAKELAEDVDRQLSNLILNVGRKRTWPL